MASAIHFEIEVPDDLARFRLPEGVQNRLQALLDQQDAGQPLSEPEQKEAEGLVNVTELLSLLRLRSERRGAIAG
jgi:hypothetical protein